MEILNAIERRIIGTLIEKSLCTPQNYPLSLNALTNGCNQKSARDPETDYTEQEILEAAQGMKRRSFTTEFFGAGSRVSKWEEAFVANMNLEQKQAAVVAELLLRGPQTEGELRGRASRMAEIPDKAALMGILEALSNREDPIVKRLSDPNRSRGVVWAHTLYPEDEAPTEEPATSTRTSTAARATTRESTGELDDRIAKLEARVTALESELGISPTGHAASSE